MYTSLGLFALVFVMHGFVLYEFAVQRRRFALEWMALMASLNLVGAAFYAMRVRICLTGLVERVLMVSSFRRDGILIVLISWERVIRSFM